MPLPLPDPPFLVISDRSQAGLPLQEVALAAFEGGCRWFSLRERDGTPSEHFLMLRYVGVVGTRYKAMVTMHGDVMPQAMTRARGMHLPSGGDVAAMRGRVPPDWLFGGSAHFAAEGAAL